MRIDLYADIYYPFQKQYLTFQSIEMLGQKCEGSKRVKITVSLPDSIAEGDVDLYGSVEDLKEVDK